MDFAQAWDEIEVGQRIVVSNGEPEPPGPSVRWSMWRSHNHEGTVVDKLVGPPREICVQLDEIDGVQVTYGVSEAVVHDFALA